MSRDDACLLDILLMAKHASDSGNHIIFQDRLRETNLSCDEKCVRQQSVGPSLLIAQ